MGPLPSTRAGVSRLLGLLSRAWRDFVKESKAPQDLHRAFCGPSDDNVVVCNVTGDELALSARITQGAGVEFAANKLRIVYIDCDAFKGFVLLNPQFPPSLCLVQFPIYAPTEIVKWRAAALATARQRSTTYHSQVEAQDKLHAANYCTPQAWA
jgi:hypothetical protein